MRPRHLLVDLGEHKRSRIGRRPSRIDAGPERALGMAIGRGELEKRRIEAHLTAREQRRDVGKEDRHEVGRPLVDRAAETPPGEQRHRAESPPAPVGRERHVPLEVEVPEADVVEVGASAEGLEERRRGRRRAVDEDVHAALDPGDDGVGRFRPVSPVGRHAFTHDGFSVSARERSRATRSVRNRAAAPISSAPMRRWSAGGPPPQGASSAA